MKKATCFTLLAVLLMAMLAFTACSRDDDDTADRNDSPAADRGRNDNLAAIENNDGADASNGSNVVTSPAEPPAGFALYEHPAHGFTLFAPTNWYYVDDALWTRDGHEDANVNINIVVTDGTGLSQALLGDNDFKAMLQGMLIDQFASMVGDAWVVEPMSGGMFGDNYFTTFHFEHTAGEGMATVQAATVVGGLMYTFTLTVPFQLGDANDYKAIFETMLASFTA